ncbi:hypothetical protein FOZ61_003920 [Perkinsus olseni]|uniref:Uncharacterized protein n=1 Tax=Perkinsus olseni TaxID=32597 RepID=A0A7J6M0Y3_PEROL|nr:hypothetical protein FOZ61_003920 [Perkinsus olseni]KAF4665189.1 hypothetical protein FOL46_003837 [Perkinsus olseni]
MNMQNMSRQYPAQPTRSVLTTALLTVGVLSSARSPNDRSPVGSNEITVGTYRTTSANCSVGDDADKTLFLTIKSSNGALKGQIGTSPDYCSSGVCEALPLTWKPPSQKSPIKFGDLGPITTNACLGFQLDESDRTFLLNLQAVLFVGANLQDLIFCKTRNGWIVAQEDENKRFPKACFMSAIPETIKSTHVAVVPQPNSGKNVRETKKQLQQSAPQRPLVLAEALKRRTPMPTDVLWEPPTKKKAQTKSILQQAFEMAVLDPQPEDVIDLTYF